MRNAFIKALTEASRENNKIALLMAEVGFSVVEGFEREFPQRFYNTGIAEQNLVSVAAGMAMGGHLPAAYSMACFLPSRAFEQIRVDVCYQNVPVVLVGVGTGLSYGNMGPTHHAIDDINIMSSLPEMTVICPCDPIETFMLTKAAFELNKPCYIAIGKNNDPILLPEGTKTQIGKANKLRDGKDAIIVATGGIASEALSASDILSERGIDMSVISMHTVKPIDTVALAQALRYPAVFTLDEHNVHGGLSQIVAEFAVKNGVYPNIFHSYAIPDKYAETVGSRDYLLRHYGIDAVSLATDILKKLRG